MPEATIWQLTPHTAAKHMLLQRYLGAWFPILTRWNGRVVFFDGFAGPGEYSGGEPGSPILALETLLDHHHLERMASSEICFIFNESERDRHDHLQTVVDRIRAERKPWPKHVRVEVTNGKFEDTAEEMLGYLAEQKVRLAPTFAFVDPFGVKGLPIELLGRLLNFSRCEVLSSSTSTRSTASPPPRTSTTAWRSCSGPTSSSRRRRPATRAASRSSVSCTSASCAMCAGSRMCRASRWSSRAVTLAIS